ncbi:aldo/keto reductase [Kushneria phosphatilytica]|uniref:Aldo/keto reductase n=1 Tax=Kushneria phosphatilytica TaxID=657387 RepID=A0A1S1NXJ7_9GAMM|nr:aldo/keto reductase [Kushneria phosphatilytica]OHV12157.1 D-threo-aldose 1-dehydrogenase [Kushneria phosphatilytica]QEL11349.1 aldo/keto reductase [Kushneria phosphatilytica]
MRLQLPGPFGFGSAPLGNMFRDIPDSEAFETVRTAWEQGLRYFDTAPQYGAGLAESRLGEVLHDEPRDHYVLSTKVGRLILEETETKSGLFSEGRPNKVVFDYSESATLRSIEESLKRLNTDRIDLVWIHDCAEDAHGAEWQKVFDTAMNGAAKALTRLREEGVIQGWGLGVNRVEPCTMTLEQADPDGFLLAGRYTLLDHANALTNLLPECERRGVGLVVGGPFNSGLLAGGEHFEYQPAPAEMIERTRRLRDICERFGVDIRAAALQFSNAHPAVASVIPGASRPERISENLALMERVIPGELWETLKSEGLIETSAPTPA